MLGQVTRESSTNTLLTVYIVIVQPLYIVVELVALYMHIAEYYYGLLLTLSLCFKRKTPFKSTREDLFAELVLILSL